MGHRAEKNLARHGYRAVITAKRKSATDEYRTDRKFVHHCPAKGTRARKCRRHA